MGRLRRRKGSLLWKQSKKLRFTDTCLIPTPHYYGQFAVSLSKQALTFSLNSTPLNTDTPLKQTLSMAPSASVSTGFDCISLHAWSKSPLSFHPFLKNGIHDKIYSVVNSDQALLSIVALCYLFCVKKLPSNPVNKDTEHERAIERFHINGVSGGGVKPC